MQPFTLKDLRFVHDPAAPLWLKVWREQLGQWLERYCFSINEI